MSRPGSRRAHRGVIDVRRAGPADLPDVLALRHEVFVVEQHVPVDEEYDDLDATCEHAVGLVDGVARATGRLLDPQEGVAVVGRMAVAADTRGHGLGAAVLAFLERRASARGAHTVELHAQVHALGFYARQGYSSYGPVYLDAGIEHRDMLKRLGA